MTASRRTLGAMLFLTVVIGASRAAAQEAAPGDRVSWYGYQTFATDATAIAFGLLTIQNENVAKVGAIGLYLSGAPTVHALHRRPLVAVGSLAMRIVAPLLAMKVAVAATDCETPPVWENCETAAELLGFVVGMGAAIIADSTALAWERKAPPPPAPPPAPRALAAPASSVSLAPLPLRDGAGLVFSGLF
jgi:hypothetical protein